MIEFKTPHFLATLAIYLMVTAAFNYLMGAPLDNVSPSLLIGLFAGWTLRTLMDVT